MDTACRSLGNRKDQGILREARHTADSRLGVVPSLPDTSVQLTRALNQGPLGGGIRIMRRYGVQGNTGHQEVAVGLGALLLGVLLVVALGRRSPAGCGNRRAARPPSRGRRGSTGEPRFARTADSNPWDTAGSWGADVGSASYPGPTGPGRCSVPVSQRSRPEWPAVAQWVEDGMAHCVEDGRVQSVDDETAQWVDGGGQHCVEDSMPQLDPDKPDPPEETLPGPSDPPATGPESVDVRAVYLGPGTPVDALPQIIQEAVDLKYNLILLTYWVDPAIGAVPGSPAYAWQDLSLNRPADRDRLLDSVHRAGARILVCAGGPDFKRYSRYDGLNAYSGSTFGRQAAQFVLDNRLDGVDFYLRGFGTDFKAGTLVDKDETLFWMRDATNLARYYFGQSAETLNNLITHSPEAQYLSWEFKSGYLDFYVGLPSTSIVNFLIIQYYNQKPTYLTYVTQFHVQPVHPDTAVAQLIDRGIPKQAIVVAKLTTPEDGDADTWVPPSDIGQWIRDAATDDVVRYWRTGIAAWRWNSPNPTDPTALDSAKFILDVFSGALMDPRSKEPHIL